ncbi:FadR/GntR family transcriptional regulator [Variovorax sp. KK3]|uniref:FadR/GntR family transcriptional regulator n=1 Tax=Variovorax sp. KK3 TaxID=1855728 RepID=UPI00097BCA42|nr:FadR/GntR family transcriptional regulator [Variovorax sp. KK3]
MPLQTLEPRRLYRQIADQLSALIAQGEFAVGSRLPAERDLAKQLGVSRPSVREALIALEVEGWVEVRTGSGVYVLDRTQQAPEAPPSTEWGPLELIRARRVVEGETAAIAAGTARRKDIEAMSRAIERMRELADHNVMPLEGDRAFHLAVVECCGNVVLAETVQGFWDSRRGPIFTRLGGYFESMRSWRSAIAEHEAIRDAIAAHDPEAARAAMHAHMDKSHQRFSASWRRANQFLQPTTETRR